MAMTKAWSELNADEQAAGATLGFTEALWSAAIRSQSGMNIRTWLNGLKMSELMVRRPPPPTFRPAGWFAQGAQPPALRDILLPPLPRIAPQTRPREPDPARSRTVSSPLTPAFFVAAEHRPRVRSAARASRRRPRPGGAEVRDHRLDGGAGRPPVHAGVVAVVRGRGRCRRSSRPCRRLLRGAGGASRNRSGRPERRRRARRGRAGAHRACRCGPPRALAPPASAPRPV